MGTTIRAYARKLWHFPVLLFASGAVAVLLLIGLAFVLSDFADTVSWFSDMLRWYSSDVDYLLTNFGDVMLNSLYLLASLFNICFFVSNAVLLGLYLLYATDCIEPTHANRYVFLACSVFSTNLVLALYTYVTGFQFFSKMDSLFMYLQNVLPANLTALVIAVFLALYVKKGKVVDFAPVLLIAGAIEVSFAVLHISGSIMNRGAAAFTLFGVTEWLIGLILPVMFVFVGYMLIKKMKRQPSRFGGYLVNRINAVQLPNQKAEETDSAEETVLEKRPAKKQLGQIEQI